MFGIIYLTTNRVNGKIYIGSDTKNCGKGDPNYYGSGLLLKKAISKYGIENFTKETILQCMNKEELILMESKFISEYSSNIRGIGYNISDGYWGGNTLTNHPDIDLIREKISNKMRYMKKHISEGIRRHYENETEEQKNIRRERVKEAMVNCDKSFLNDPHYGKRISEGLKKSDKFKEYGERRIGSTRGKYKVDFDSMIERRKQKIDLLRSECFKKILSDNLYQLDSGTFSCYAQVYLHLDNILKIDNLGDFIEYIENRIYNNSLTLADAKKEYYRLNLNLKKLGKSSTVVKSIYEFGLYGKYPGAIVNPNKKFKKKYYK